MEITEFEKKRAANLIWSAANNYEIHPGFRVYDEDGKADLYWNCIVGSIYLHYDWDKLYAFYTTFYETIAQTMYENLFWIAMESAAYAKEEKERPVFPYLRHQYAERKLENLHPGMRISETYSDMRADIILMGHLRHALGQPSGLPDEVDQKLLRDLEIGADLDTDQIIEKLKATYEYYFTYLESKRRKTQKKHFTPSFSFFHRRKRRPGEGDQELTPVRHLSFGYGEHMSEYGGQEMDQAHLRVRFSQYSSQTDEGLKKYIQTYFGLPALSEAEIRKLEKNLCTGNHEDCHLHITRGDYTKKMAEQEDYAGVQRREAIAQEKKNLEAYHANEDTCRFAIEKLTERIRNSMLVQMDDQVVKAPSGRLAANRIWRQLTVADDKIFDKTLRGDNGNLSVDIVIDGSTSQNPRRETVSTQGYIIAEALTRCQIPVRVSSFCSMNGYTIMNLFRDYGENDRNRNIFRYFTAGANRDGLAVRLATEFIRKNSADHRILILLTDCRPNDVIKMKSSSGNYRDYVKEAGVEDTASEVHAARMQGIQVICIFTGEDEDVPSVKHIYNRDFVRIRSLDMFADTVGSLLQRQIRSL